MPKDNFMIKTQEEISQEIIKKTSTAIPQITNYRTGGVFRTFIEVVASFLEKFYKELDELLPNRFLQTATGEYLDLKAEELSLTRLPATKTRGYVLVSRGSTNSAVTIPKDKIIATKPNSRGVMLRYKVVGDVVLQENEITRSVLVEAEKEGALYNVVGGQITELITPIVGINTLTNNSSWIVGMGRDIESDASLRSRCMALWAGLSGANKNAYISWAKSVEGIGDVRVISTARGLGTVDVICIGKDNVQANAELLEKVKNVLDERKPISTNVEVKAPIEVFLSINLTVAMNPTIDLNRQVIEEAIQRYFSTLGIGMDFEPSALASMVFEVRGVKSAVINTPISTKITELQIARLGTIALELKSSLEK